MDVRLGDILARRGILNGEQITRALARQKTTREPFGVVCERLFGIAPDAVEEAWEEQYVSITRKIDPRTEEFDNAALQLVSRRQAWQFRVLPIRFDGDELMMATTARHLRRALRFTTKFIGVPVYFVIAEADALGEELCRRYPLAGMTAQSIDDHSLDRLLTLARLAPG